MRLYQPCPRAFWLFKCWGGRNLSRVPIKKSHLGGISPARFCQSQNGYVLIPSVTPLLCPRLDPAVLTPRVLYMAYSLNLTSPLLSSVVACLFLCHSFAKFLLNWLYDQEDNKGTSGLFPQKCVRFNCAVHKYILNNSTIILTAISVSTIWTKTNWSGVVFLWELTQVTHWDPSHLTVRMISNEKCLPWNVKLTHGILLRRSRCFIQVRWLYAAVLLVVLTAIFNARHAWSWFFAFTSTMRVV